jgi:hypothetical protein
MRCDFKFLIILLLLVLLQSTSAQTTDTEPDDGIPIATFSGETEDAKYSSTVNRGEIRNTSSWDSLSGNEPPLSVKDAVINAQSKLSKLVRDIKEWEVTDIRMMPLVLSQKWIYVVEFKHKRAKGEYPAGMFFRLIVKMDGEVAEPEELFQKRTIPKFTTIRKYKKSEDIILALFY